MPERLVTFMEVQGEGAAQAARRLAEQVVAEPATASAEALMDRLRSIAAGASDP